MPEDKAETLYIGTKKDLVTCWVYTVFVSSGVIYFYLLAAKLAFQNGVSQGAKKSK